MIKSCHRNCAILLLGHKTITFSIAKLEVIRFNVLNKVFIWFRWPISSVRSINSSVLWIENLSFRCSITNARWKVLVIYFFYFLEIFVFVCICDLIICSNVECVSESRIADMKIALDTFLSWSDLPCLCYSFFGEILIAIFL